MLRFLPSEKNEIFVSLPERCDGRRAKANNVCAIGEALEIPEESIPRVANVLLRDEARRLENSPPKDFDTPPMGLGNKHLLSGRMGRSDSIRGLNPRNATHGFARPVPRRQS
jgi:hypothetical protein